MAYIGRQQDGFGVRSRFIYTATGGQTTFNTDDSSNALSYSDGAYVDVYLNGVLLDPADYTATSLTSIVLGSGATASDILEVIVYDVFSVFSGTFTNGITANTATVTGDLTVDTDTLFVDSTNNEVGIGTTSPAGQLHISGDDVSNQVIIENTSADANSAPDLLLKRNSSTPADDDEVGQIVFQGRNDNSQFPTLATMKVIYKDVTDTTEDAALVYELMTAGTRSEVMRIEGGNVGIGTSSISADLHVVAGAAGDSVCKLLDNGGFGFNFIPRVGGSGADNQIRTGSGESISIATSNTERMRIESGGTLLIAQTANDSGVAGHIFNTNGSAFHVRDGGLPFVLNRLTDDGALVALRQDGTTEGSISVSGTTVSYNGGHLSRWSQLTDGTKDTSILKGTVMTNLDQMAVWSHDAVAATYYVDGDELPEGVSVGDEKTPAKDAFTEDNEQLNCMAVSSVEGDANVAGVFVNWDNDDDQFNDMNVAMTGDMVIRIASGTTVARGDLLISAGDGTAKTQDDDIVRSKTIAKVTSTNVSHTYDDGSYLVPCVLMAC